MEVKLKASSLADYLNCIKELVSYWGLDRPGKPYHEAESLWFRGHQDASWKLTPKFYRDEFKNADEADIRQEFQSRALQLIQGRVPTDKWEWYFLMQHYGAPTRLLDWSDNPLLALYFAVADHSGKQDAAVWTIDPTWLNNKLGKEVVGAILPDWQEANSYLRDLEEAYEESAVAKVRLPAAIDPPHVDRRLAAQSSRFIIFGLNHDLMQSKKIKSEREKKRHLKMITIPRKSISTIRDELYTCGFTHSFVFPDLQGLCTDICRKHRG
jgi:FRG domain